MSDYKMITDSACDLPQAMLRELDVTVVPLRLLFRGENIPDSVEDEKIREIYRGLRAGEDAKTSVANPQGWASVMEPILAAGQDILALTFSSGLSTTYQSAVIAAADLLEKYPQRKIRVVDTLAAALGQGLLVWYTCQKRDQGLSLEELTAWVEGHKRNLAHWFTVDDLMYLKRGGRISAATALVGTLLQIKPVLFVDHEGHLISVAKARGRKAALSMLVRKLVELGEGFDQEMVFICHGDCIEDARIVEDMVRAQTGTKNIMVGNLGAVIGSHAGPGTVSLFFMGKAR